MTKKYDGLESEIGYVREDMSQKKTAVFALETIINMYMAQIQQIDKILNEMLLKKNQAISSVRLLAASLMPVRPLNDNSQATQHDDGEKHLKIINIIYFIFELSFYYV